MSGFFFKKQQKATASGIFKKDGMHKKIQLIFKMFLFLKDSMELIAHIELTEMDCK